MIDTTPSYAQGQALQVLSFEVGAQTYCVPVSAVREIRGVTPPTPLPGLPALCARRHQSARPGHAGHRPVVAPGQGRGAGRRAPGDHRGREPQRRRQPAGRRRLRQLHRQPSTSTRPRPWAASEDSPLVSAVITSGEGDMTVLLAVSRILPERQIALAA